MVRGGVAARPWWDTSNPDERLAVPEDLLCREERREVRVLSLAPIYTGVLGKLFHIPEALLNGA